MYDLLEMIDGDAFTTSEIIAKGTDNKHSSMQRIILKYYSDFEEFGQVRFEIRPVKYARGTNEEKVYILNEQQATVLMTYLRNNDITRAFKKELVRQFFRMREYIRQKQSDEWEKTRIASKENRLKETDVIKLLAEYAEEQGSTHSDMLYMSYTKLAKSVISGKRDEMSITDLNNITLIENIILQTIRLDMAMGMHYKDIYKDCKDRVDKVAELAYLNEQKKKGLIDKKKK